MQLEADPGFPVEPGPRNARIDLLRGIAIVLVLFHHFNIAYRLDGTVLARLLGWDAVRAVARNGNYGVTMFFVISGFLITSNAKRRWGALDSVKVREFYGMRVARIIPCLLLLLAVVNVLAWAGLRSSRIAPLRGRRLPSGSSTWPR
jgi:peptidoglycan/LPS O-acetylase OafA/YrhL